MNVLIPVRYPLNDRNRWAIEMGLDLEVDLESFLSEHLDTQIHVVNEDNASA